jgi:hypothetical protein
VKLAAYDHLFPLIHINSVHLLRGAHFVATFKDRTSY